MSVMNVLWFILIVYIECCEKTLLMYVLYIVANKLQLLYEYVTVYFLSKFFCHYLDTKKEMFNGNFLTHSNGAVC